MRVLMWLSRQFNEGMLEEMLRGGNRGIVGFDPTTIPGCTVWFDAADIGTMSLSVSSLQSWKSKGSATCTATYKYNAPSISTIGGLSTLYFNGVSTMMTTNTVASYGATETTWITCAASLATVSASTPADACPVIATQGAGAERSIRYTCNVNATAYSINTSVLRQTTGDNTNGVRGFIDTAAYFAGFTNGALIASNTTAVTFQAGYNQSFVMGQWNIGWLYGYVYEILIYNRALSMGEYQSVEGYLSQKWGFSPAKVFKPTSVPGCQLWLDGADQRSMTLSGSTITAWNDKSGNSQSFTVTGTPAIVTDSQSGNSCVSFNGTSYFYNTTLSTPIATHTSFLVAKIIGTAYYGIVSFASGAVSSYQSANAFRYGGNGGTTLTSDMLDVYANNGGYQILLSVATANTFLMAEQTTTGSPYPTGALYYNGSLPTPTATTQFNYTPGTAAGIVVGSYWYNSTGNSTFVGNICELIVYNQTLTTAQRQQVEGYLAWKWGLQASLPSTHPNYITTANFVKSGTLVSTHPFYSQMPMTRTFTPMDIPGCAMWLDGADSATIIGSVTSIREKVNNATFTATGTVTTSTIGTTPSLNFAGAGYLSGSVNSLLVGTSFIVFNATATQGAYRTFFTWRDNAGQANFPAFGYISGNNIIGPYTTFVGLGTLSNTISVGNTYLTSYSWSGTTATFGINGTTPAIGTQPAFSSTETLMWIAYDNGGYTTTNIGEMLLYNTVLSAAQRQSVEGYLAAKWGLKPSLPAFVNPTSIPGCQLWLDGTDPAGTGIVPAAGATVATWVDKSGNGYNATAVGTPTYSNKGMLLTRASSQYFTLPNGTYPSGANPYSIFMAFNLVSYSVAGFIGAGDYSTTWGTIAVRGNASQSIQLYWWGDSGNLLTTNTFTLNTPNILCTTGTSTARALYLNAQPPTTDTQTGPRNQLTTGNTIGRAYPADGTLDGYISEVLVYNSVLTTAQRQQVEGYLAWKWGLQASLPSTHPFYATVPVPHPFNKVPPTIRQPALYYDVAPGNWTRDWQPYLKALARANSTGVTVTTTNITGGATYGVGIFGQGAVLAPNGNMYGCPWGGGTSLLVLNPNTGTTSNLTGGATYVSNGWAGGVLAPNGNIYYAPSSATNILYLNPNTGVTGNITGGATFPATGFKWFGGVLAPNGNIYYSPLSSLNILVLNPTTGVTSNITGGATYPGGYAWAGGVLAPNGNIYFAPYSATNILVLNPDTGITSNITGAATYTGSGWVGGVLAPNGNIYFIPCNANNFLVLNPNTGVTSNLTGGATYIANGWYEGVLGPDGNIYGTPWYSSNIIVLNPNTGVTSNITGGATFTSAGWQGAVLAPNGNIYCFPTNATNILKITFSGLAQLPNSNYCLSAYTNKY